MQHTHIWMAVAASAVARTRSRVLPERKLLPAGRQPEVIPSISPSLRGTVLLPCPETVLDKLFSDFVADRKFLS